MLGLEAQRKKAGLSRAKLARLVGVDISTVYRYEKRLRKPKLDIAMKLAKVLKTSVDTLIADV